LIAGNTSPSNPDFSGPVASGKFNLIANGTGLTGLTNALQGNHIGTGAALINPHLGPLSNNGGPTLTFALHPNSPAINAASNALIRPRVQIVTIAGSAGTFTLTFNGQTTIPVAFNASAA